MANADANLFNKNLLQTEEFHNADEYTLPVTIRCPHCLVTSSFHPCLPRSYTYRKAQPHPNAPNQNHHVQFKATLRICPSDKCRGLVLTVISGATVMRVIPNERLEFDPQGVPGQLVSTLLEAVDCHSCGAFRASALMVRRLMEELCEAQGAKGNNLYQRLEDLGKKVPVSIALLDGARELRILGNDAAHIEAKEYASIGKEEAEIAIEVGKEILKAFYQHQSLVERLQKLKKSQ